MEENHVTLLTADALDGKYLTYFLDHQLYGVPIACVEQIIGVQRITEMPDYPPYAKGVINLRGAILPVVDMRLRLGKPEVPYNERTSIIVIRTEHHLVGFLVDAVCEVTQLPPENISPPPDIPHSGGNSYLMGIGKQEDTVVLLLDMRKILSGDQIFQLSDEVDVNCEENHYV